jgi:hypothetical protein
VKLLFFRQSSVSEKLTSVDCQKRVGVPNDGRARIAAALVSHLTAPQRVVHQQQAARPEQEQRGKRAKSMLNTHNTKRARRCPPATGRQA